MMDRAEYKEKTKKTTKTEPLHQFMQASVEATRLTNDTSWDYFLTIVQGIYNQADEAKQINQTALNAEVFDHVELLKIKSAITRCDERLITLDMILNLPNQIKQEGQKAKALIDDLPIVSGRKSIFGRNR
ncbi:MAG: hypothetical protein BMS9Abin21_187 [Thermodesulfovibrionia bacterium]|nr:MAG: hypothetical protein BMS9Abin21_187 [Thermodesulfovibrionia bacterium]